MWLGLAMVLGAGLLSGNCMLPMKFVRRWAWENVWLVFTLISLVLIPWALGFMLVRDLAGVYASLPPDAYTVPVLFGAGWGIAQVLFGISIARLGLALGYAIIIGLGALGGTLVPLFIQNREVVGTSKGMAVLAGVAVMLVGIAISAVAGRDRERLQKSGSAAASGSYAVALSLAVLCGVMAPMINYSFAFGNHIAERAVQLGTSATDAGYAVWPLTLTGGLVPNLLYSLYLLRRNKTWSRFSAGRSDVWLAVLMGVLWMGAVSIYGVASVYLGTLGTSAGWALFQIFMIMTANVSGMITGEWRGVPRRTVSVFWGGQALLAVATVLIALGNR